MAKSRVVLSFGYWFSSFSLGLVVHPYKTMRQLVREHIMLKLRFLPLVLWGLSWVLGMFVLRLGGLVVQLIGVGGAVVGIKMVLGFLFLWWSVFLSIWQVVLWYLWRRFQVISNT